MMVLPRALQQPIKPKIKMSYSVNSLAEVPPIGSPIRIEDRVIGSVIKVDGTNVIAEINDNELFNRHYHYPEKISMGCTYNEGKKD